MTSTGSSPNANGRRLLFFTKNQKALKPVVAFLRLQGYSVAILDHLRDPATAIAAVKPQAVLLSWTLGGDEVKRAYNQLSQDPTAPVCVVYLESGSPREVSALSRSGIRTTIFPPLSGRGIQTRLQSFMTRKTVTKAKNELSEEERSSLANVRAATAQELPKDPSLAWSLVDGENDASKIWRCETAASAPGAKGRVYLVEADEAPKFDAKKQKWTGTDGLILVNDEPAKVISPVLAHAAFNMTEYRVQAAELNAAASAFKDFRNKNFPGGSALESAVRTSAENVFTPEPGESKKLHQLQTAGALVVRDPEKSGYLLLASADNGFDKALLQALAMSMFPKLGIKPVPPAPEDLLCIELDPITFENWGERVEFVAVFNHKGQDVAVLWIPSTNLPSPIAKDDKLLNVSPKDNLFPDSVIGFDLYLHMPKNDKYLLYLKSGAEVSKTVLEKFERFKVDRLAIEKSALEEFIAYLINGVVKPKDD